MFPNVELLDLVVVVMGSGELVLSADAERRDGTKLNNRTMGAKELKESMATIVLRETALT